jgi:hypothetical protein
MPNDPPTPSFQPITLPPDYHAQTAAETFARILAGTNQWVAVGDFLDDWRRLPLAQRAALVAEPIAEAGEDEEMQRWAAFCAAMVEWLCWQDHLPFPAWTSRTTYILALPWFLYPGWRLRAWQLATTPAPFKMRNIYGGDRILDRV